MSTLHYYRKDDIPFARITGASIAALCGYYGPISKSLGEILDDPNAIEAAKIPLCESCVRFYSRLEDRAEQDVTV